MFQLFQRRSLLLEPSQNISENKNILKQELSNDANIFHMSLAFVGIDIANGKLTRRSQQKTPQSWMESMASLKSTALHSCDMIIAAEQGSRIERVSFLHVFPRAPSGHSSSPVPRLSVLRPGSLTWNETRPFNASRASNLELHIEHNQIPRAAHLERHIEHNQIPKHRPSSLTSDETIKVPVPSSGRLPQQQELFLSLSRQAL